MDKKIDFQEISVHDVPEKSPGFLLWHISTLWRSCIENVLRPLDLTHPQFVVLATLGWLTRNGDKVTQRALGKMANLDPNTLSQIIKGLERRSLLKREPSLDARAKNPLLTSMGQDILKRALPSVEAADAQFFNRLSSKEMHSLIRLFQKF